MWSIKGFGLHNLPRKLLLDLPYHMDGTCLIGPLRNACCKQSKRLWTKDVLRDYLLNALGKKKIKNPKYFSPQSFSECRSRKGKKAIRKGQKKPLKIQTI